MCAGTWHVHPHTHVTRGRVAAQGGTGRTGRDGKNERDGQIESAEVRQKRRNSVKEMERDGRTGKGGRLVRRLHEKKRQRDVCVCKEQREIARRCAMYRATGNKSEKDEDAAWKTGEDGRGDAVSRGECARVGRL